MSPKPARSKPEEHLLPTSAAAKREAAARHGNLKALVETKGAEQAKESRIHWHPLWMALLLASMAQVAIHFEYLSVGALLYLISMVGMAMWASRNPAWKDAFSQQSRLPVRAEKILLAMLILVVLVTRFYDLGYRVYALESDESKWTAQSWYSVLLGEEYGEFHDKHYIYLPVDFWVRAVFLYLFGVHYASARFESALISIVAVIFLYLLARRLLENPLVALLSTLLYGLSFGELTASHQALHHSPIALWMAPGLYFLLSAIQSKEKWRFQVSGILMALGMLTYDTFLPTAAFALVCLTVQGIYEIAKKKAAAKDWLLYLALTAWPITITYAFFTHRYLVERYSGYYYQYLPNLSTISLADSAARLLQGGTAVWRTTFFRVAADQYLDWTGPLVNPWLLPWVAVGLGYTLWNIRQSRYLFLAVFYLFQILPATLMNIPYPRILYPTLAPLTLWGALGLWMGYVALRSKQGSARWGRLALAVFSLAIGAILIQDYRIFTSALHIPEERVVRRELADFSTASAEEAGMLLCPYLPSQHDPLEIESNVILFSVSGAHRVDLEQARQKYRQLEASQLMLTLWQMRHLPGLDILFEKNAPTHQQDRLASLQAVLTCYPQTQLTRRGRFFDLYHLSAAALSQPRCHTAPLPRALQPVGGISWPANQPVTFAWQTDDVSGSSYEITVERMRSNLQWIEVEHNFQGPGWIVDAKFADGFYGAGFLLDDWQAQPASLDYFLAQAGTYHVWVRFYKRLDNDQQNFLQIANRTFSFAQTGSPLNEWIWQDVGSLDLPGGSLPLSIFRAYGQDAQYSIFVDTLALTTDSSYNPNMDPPWIERFQSGEFSTAGNEYTSPYLLPPGDYRWKVSVFDRDRLVDAMGGRGIKSDYSWFTIVLEGK